LVDSRWRDFRFRNHCQNNACADRQHQDDGPGQTGQHWACEGGPIDDFFVRKVAAEGADGIAPQGCEHFADPGTTIGTNFDDHRHCCRHHQTDKDIDLTRCSDATALMVVG
jgi:hypothetical protein